MGKINKQKLITILGPTASGKSELAVQIAKKINGEIISADSRQVYRNLDVGTGKVPGKWQASDNSPKVFIYKKIPHYCIDFVNPEKVYTAAEFKKCAEDAIAEITSRGKTPILAGGTGFWIDTVAYDLNLPQVTPDWKLRRKLEKKPIAELLKILKKIDPKKAKNIDIHNRRRLERAIEIAKVLGSVPAISRKSPYRILWIGIKPDGPIWELTLRKRVVSMIKKGILKETKNLLRNRLLKSKIKEFGFEYQETARFLNKEISKKELLKNIIKRSRDYAKRQMTWFKKNSEIIWVRNFSDTQKHLKTFSQPQKH